MRFPLGTVLLAMALHSGLVEAQGSPSAPAEPRAETHRALAAGLTATGLGAEWTTRLLARLSGAVGLGLAGAEARMLLYPAVARTRSGASWRAYVSAGATYASDRAVNGGRLSWAPEAGVQYWSMKAGGFLDLGLVLRDLGGGRRQEYGALRLMIGRSWM